MKPRNCARVSGFLQNLNRYTISRIPKEETMSMTMNQFLWLFCALRHRAIPFQNMDQVSKTNKKMGLFNGRKELGDIRILYHRDIWNSSNSNLLLGVKS